MADPKRLHSFKANPTCFNTYWHNKLGQLGNFIVLLLPFEDFKIVSWVGREGSSSWCSWHSFLWPVSASCLQTEGSVDSIIQSETV